MGAQAYTKVGFGITIPNLTPHASVDYFDSDIMALEFASAV